MSLLRRRPPASIAELIEKPRVGSLEFFGLLRWLDGAPLLDRIEAYRRRLFTEALDAFDVDGRPHYNLVLAGRAKKNWKSADLVLVLLFRLVANDSPGGNQVYLLANDEDQAADDLTLAKKLIAVNPLLAERLTVKKNVIERRDGRGFLAILAAGDIVGSHGKTYDAAGFDEIHGYRTWDILEALQPDPSRPEALIWITSYASIYHRPGVPLYDLCAQGRAGLDPRMLFSWYAADFCTDPDFADKSPEERANPSMASWEDPDYLAQQRRRLPAHKLRRLHLNLPGLPEGSAISIEMIEAGITRGVRLRPYVPGVKYKAFADHSHGSSDDATVGLGHEEDGRLIVDVVMNQGPPPPFSMVTTIPRFAAVLAEYHVCEVWGDNVGAETYQEEWGKAGIIYHVCKKSTSELYEALQVPLNQRRVELPDLPLLEQQLLGLVWKGQKITHPVGEHDDWSNAAAGVVSLLLGHEFVGLWFLRSDRPMGRVPEPVATPMATVDKMIREGEVSEELARQRVEDEQAAFAEAQHAKGMAEVKAREENAKRLRTEEAAQEAKDRELEEADRRRLNRWGGSHWSSWGG